MSFFDSELIKKEMDEITRLQEQVYGNTFSFYHMDDETKLEHVHLLRELLEKQRIMYTRLSLSDDPKAKDMQKHILNSASMMGLPDAVDMNVVFGKMQEMVDVMEAELEG